MLKEKTYLFAKCKECGRTWNISVFKQIPSNGYICPYCRGKAKREQRNIRNKMAAGAAKYLILTLTGIILFHMTAEAAYIERGYRAYGGEYLLLLLPLIWYAIETTVHDTIKEAKKPWRAGNKIELIEAEGNK